MLDIKSESSWDLSRHLKKRWRLKNLVVQRLKRDHRGYPELDDKKRSMVTVDNLDLDKVFLQKLPKNIVNLNYYPKLNEVFEVFPAAILRDTQIRNNKVKILMK